MQDTIPTFLKGHKVSMADKLNNESLITFPLSVVGVCVQALANKEKWRNCEFAHSSTQYMQEHEGVPSGRIGH